MIPPQGNAAFVAAMERVLEVYQRPYDAAFPMACMDETPRQLIGEARVPIPMKAGQPARQDYEYRGYGTCNVFMAIEPLAGRRMTRVAERKTEIDRAQFLSDMAEQYRDAPASPWSLYWPVRSPHGRPHGTSSGSRSIGSPLPRMRGAN